MHTRFPSPSPAEISVVRMADGTEWAVCEPRLTPRLWLSLLACTVGFLLAIVAITIALVSVSGFILLVPAVGAVSLAFLVMVNPGRFSRVAYCLESDSLRIRFTTFGIRKRVDLRRDAVRRLVVPIPDQPAPEFSINLLVFAQPRGHSSPALSVGAVEWLAQAMSLWSSVPVERVRQSELRQALSRTA